MGKPGVDGKNTKTNHIVEVKKSYDTDKQRQIFEKYFVLLLTSCRTAFYNEL